MLSIVSFADQPQIRWIGKSTTMKTPNFLKSIRITAIAVAILPALIMFMLLIPYFLHVLTVEIEDALDEEGRTITEYVAHASEYALISGDTEYLEDILAGLIVQPIIHEISVTDVNQNVVIQRTDEFKRHAGEPLVFTRPVFRNLAPAQTFDLIDGFSSNENSSLLSSTRNANSEVIGNITVELTTEQFVSERSKIITNNIVVGIVALIVSVVVGLRLGNNIVRPIGSIVRGVNRLRQGHYHTSIGIEADNEIGDLAQGIDRLGAELSDAKKNVERHVNELKEARENADQLVEERTKELRAARDKAHQASQAKSAFVANVSHELRTPLQAIIGFASLINESSIEGSRIGGYSNNILASAAHLNKLIGQVLDLSQIEAGKIELEREIVNVCEMVHDAAVTVNGIIERNGNNLVIACANDIGAIYGDRTKIQEILINLLSNAAKYTRNGRVELVVKRRKSDNQLIITVTDAGIGIPPNKLDTIFEKFERVDDPIHVSVSGTGLGLPITKLLCSLMGGAITVNSTVGKGSVFTVTLPVEFVLDRATIPQREPDYGALRNLTVLVAEDDELVRDIIAKILTNQRIRTTVCADGNAAWCELSQNRFDLAILDLNMPRLSGIEVIRKYRSNSNVDPSLPFIVLTADATDTTYKTLATAGVYVLTKPIMPNELLGFIKEVINGAPLPEAM